MPNVNEQLREAASLIKQGRKREAGQIVQTILQMDKENAQAWWLMANLLDEESKVISCLERVLKIQPEHTGAQELLARLRPATTNLSDLFAEAEKEVAGNASPKKTNQSLSDEQRLQKRITYAMVTLVAVVAAAVVTALILPLLRIAGDEPVEVSRDYIQAFANHDFDTMRDLTCDKAQHLIDEVENRLLTTNGIQGYTLDIEGIRYEEVSREEREARVQVGGRLVLRPNNTTAPLILTFDEIAPIFRNTPMSNHLILIGEWGRWRVCVA